MREAVPELEALHALAMVLHNQYPWDRARTRLNEVGELDDDDFVVVFAPRNQDVLEFIRRVKAGRRRPPAARAARRGARPVAPYPPVQVRERFRVMPRLEALAVVKGEHACTNEDLIRNARLQLVADDGRGDRAEDRHRGAPLHRARPRRHLAPGRRGALAAAGRRARGDRRGDLLLVHEREADPVASRPGCPGQLGIFQTHASFDLVAACAGFPTGWARRCACSRRSSGRCCSSAPRSSPTRSAPCGRRG